ncbi:MAG: homoaconitase [Candidatus Cloacimonetes bacterium 4572_55]|nr:MAG: homoaconitase [Candidatus Cloacimonetes bacterium 4572_55]
MGQNLIEKIAQRYAVGLESGKIIKSGDYLSIRPAHVMTHDNSGAVIPKFLGIGAKKIADPRQVVFTLDHDIQNTSETNLAKYSKIEAFAKKNGIDFYPAGRGIGHQIMCEEGYVWPGTMVVASDSHSNMYGGLGCLGTPIVRTDAASIWATGRTWWKIPPVAKVELKGELKPGVTGKDVIITLCGFFNKDEVLNHTLEFVGNGVSQLSIDQRLTIANMTTEWGALAGIFPIDEVTFDWLKKRINFIHGRGFAGVPSDVDGANAHPRINQERLEKLRADCPTSDPDAFYAKELTLDLSEVRPHVAGPDHVKSMTSILEMRQRNVKIHKAYLLSCVNSRVEDLSQAAAVVRGKKVAKGVEFYVAAASNETQAESVRRGDWKYLVDAGAIILPPGCGPCIGLGAGVLGENEVGISATNRNFKGRMGARSAKAYLASPAVVAASAISGRIDYPEDKLLPDVKTHATIRVNEKSGGVTSQVEISQGFQEKLTGELIFCHQDNINTDGIYPGKYTYIDEFTREQQADVVMENYDPNFRSIVKKEDILVGGFNFGTGSSREQAATALKYRGVGLILAGSFSETYKRNALNNGFLTIEAPDLVRDLKAKLGTNKLTVRAGIEALIHFKESFIEADGKRYVIDPVGSVAQELVIVGGLENWVKKNVE